MEIEKKSALTEIYALSLIKFREKKNEPAFPILECSQRKLEGRNFRNTLRLFNF